MMPTPKIIRSKRRRPPALHRRNRAPNRFQVKGREQFVAVLLTVLVALLFVFLRWPDALAIVIDGLTTNPKWLYELIVHAVLPILRRL